MPVDELELDGDCDISGTGGSPDDNKFDGIVGKLEEILMDDDFADLQRNYMRSYCDVFEGTEENKLVYTSIHSEYADLVENFVAARIGKVDFDWFLEALASRGEDAVSCDIWECLYSALDFRAFKEEMLAVKTGGGKASTDLFAGILQASSPKKSSSRRGSASHPPSR